MVSRQQYLDTDYANGTYQNISKVLRISSSIELAFNCLAIIHLLCELKFKMNKDFGKLFDISFKYS